MKNNLVTLTSDRLYGSCAAFDDEYLYISFQIAHKTADELKQAAQTGRSGMNGYTVIELKTIREVKCYQKGEHFLVRYEVSGKQKKYGMQISDRETRLEFCEALAQASGLKTKTEKKDPYSRVPANAIPIVFIALVTAVCSVAASDLIPPAGRESRGRFMSETLKIIGPTAILIVGIILIGFFVFRMLRNIKNSDMKLMYT